jgi:mRNA-degrading endonuclease YafQ of YafQ-DinJ toxin-antitoxin module
MDYRDCFVKQTETLFYLVQKQKEQLFLLKNERNRVVNLIRQLNSNDSVVNVKETVDMIQTLVHKCIQFYKDNRDHVNRVFLF